MPAVISTTGSKASAAQIIRAAMRVLNVVASGEDPEPEELEDALTVLNGMINSWQIERLMIFTIQRLQFFVGSTGQPPLKQVYTVGPTGDFNIPWPPAIPRIGVINLSNPLQPLELPMEMLTDVGWQSIPVKNIQSTLPTKVWDDLSFPLRNLSVFPVPTVPVGFALYIWSAIQEFSDLNTQFSFPPGYLSAMKYGLAMRLAPEFGQASPPPIVAQMAIESKARIKTHNIVSLEMRCDEALVNSGRTSYNWITDGPGSADRG